MELLFVVAITNNILSLLAKDAVEGLAQGLKGWGHFVGVVPLIAVVGIGIEIGQMLFLVQNDANPDKGWSMYHPIGCCPDDGVGSRRSKSWRSTMRLWLVLCH